MSPADPARLEAQLRFLVEVDRLKNVLRQTRLVDGSRRENSAEHSWHLGVAAVLLAEYAPPGTDLARVLAMVLVHDLVEIDAGDTFCYDAGANLGREDRERLAADRLFGMLPEGQGVELRALWDEFEAGRSPEARFAVALDRLQPLLQNFHGGGGTWREHGVAHDRVVARMRPIESGAPPLWPAVAALLDQALARGFMQPPPRPAE